MVAVGTRPPSERVCDNAKQDEPLLLELGRGQSELSSAMRRQGFAQIAEREPLPSLAMNSSSNRQRLAPADLGARGDP